RDGGRRKAQENTPTVDFGSVATPRSAADSRHRRPEARKGWRDEERIEDARRGSAGPLDAAFRATRGPREIAGFVGWDGARPPRTRRCKDLRGRETPVRVVLFTGKGGVGKTSVAAATAVRCAAAGYRTVAMSTDPAHSLGDSFDLELGAEATKVGDNLW